ncbi:unnamed protein product [Tuber aestivum]|uniref:Seipin n=1 Tax=Tuber aestivum TaxID=59557 RepID=A0A292Q7C9_9PEZI|nr:unnamed protein product [Tuber aestivum]
MDFAPYQSESPEVSRNFTRPTSPPARSSYSPLPTPQAPPPILPTHSSPSGWSSSGLGRETINQFETSLPIRLDWEAVMAYVLLPPAGGVLLLILEHKSDYVRFHAWQSSLLFAFLVILHLIFSFSAFLSYSLLLADLGLIGYLGFHAYVDADTLDRSSQQSNGFLLLLLPPRFLRILLSRPAQRAYLTTLLLSISTLVLFFLAVISYTLFYIHHVPHIGVQKPLHLQFPTSPSTSSLFPHQHRHPTGVIHFNGEIIPRQEYSVALLLLLPSSPENQNAGNFMAEITIYSTPPSPSSSASAPGTVIATSRRGGLIPWRSPIARTAHTLLRLPLLLFLPNTKEEEAVRVVLLEDVVFDEPARHAVVSLESRSRLDVYEARVELHAKLAGIRWIMWRWRVLSFLLGSGLFFAVEVFATVVVWWVVYGWFAGSGTLPAPGEGTYPEDEEGEEGDRVDGADDLGFDTPESIGADDEEEEGDDEVLLKSDVGDSGIGSLSESLGTTARERSVGGAGGSSSGGSRRRRTRSG